MDLLHRLDETCAVKFNLIKAPAKRIPTGELTLAEGRRLYEEHGSRPRLLGGLKHSSVIRYRCTFNKFIPWVTKAGINCFQQITKDVLEQYVAHLEQLGRAQKTILNDLTTLKQCINWLIEAGHLADCEPIQLKLRKPESQRAYCYRQIEVNAMLDHCKQRPELRWLGDVILALASTGMQIDELINLKWGDVDLEGERITLTEESGRAPTSEPRRSLKSGRSRWFHIYPDLLAVLKALPQGRKYVFAGPCVGKLDDDLVRKALIRDVLKPLAPKFPPVAGRKSFIDGRLHSFRHFFISRCAVKGTSQEVVMAWVGHADSAMVRHYFHLQNEDARQQMQRLDLFGDAAGRSGGDLPIIGS